MLTKIEEYLNEQHIEYNDFEENGYEGIYVYDTYGFSYFEITITILDKEKESAIFEYQNVKHRYDTVKEVINKIDEIVSLEIEASIIQDNINKYSYERSCMFNLLNSNNKDKILNKETLDLLQEDYDRLCQETKELRNKLDELFKED